MNNNILDKLLKENKKFVIIDNYSLNEEIINISYEPKKEYYQQIPEPSRIETKPIKKTNYFNKSTE